MTPNPKLAIMPDTEVPGRWAVYCGDACPYAFCRAELTVRLRECGFGRVAIKRFWQEMYSTCTTTVVHRVTGESALALLVAKCAGEVTGKRRS